MALNFKAGDVVRLKSGGPAMTIARAPERDSDQYTCNWFKGASGERGFYFDHELEPYVAPQKP